MSTLSAQREEIRKLLQKRGNGSFLRGWRYELDRDGMLEVHFQSLANFAERHAVKLDLCALFGHDRDRMIPLKDICPKSDALLSSLQELVKRHFGGPMGMVREGEHQTREGLGRLWQLRGFKATEEEIKELLSFIDVDEAGIAGEDLTFLEPELVQRRHMAVLRRQKRRMMHEEILTKAFSEDTSELPSTHRLAVRPWQASVLAEKLPRLQNQKQHRWRRQQRQRNRQAKELFLAHLKDMSGGSIVRAWRMKLDCENRSSMDELSLRKYCSKAGVQLDVSALWQALDADKDGLLRLEVLHPEAAEVLAHFRKWANDISGSCTELWDSEELVEARKQPQRDGRWRSEKKMLLGHLQEVLKQHFARSAPALLFNSLDAYGCGFVSREDFAWLDGWQPCAWIAAEADAEEWAILKALLIRLEGHPLRAWRKRLDKDDSNSVSWSEFHRCFEELNFRGNVPGAWRHLDERMSGVVSLKAYDSPSAQLLGSFKSWAEENFGSVHRAFSVLDNDGSGSISMAELQRACKKRSWPGDVQTLFRCLDVEAEDHPRLTLAELSFLDHWEASDSEEDAAPPVPAFPPPLDPPKARGSSARRGSSAVRPALPELRSQSQPVKPERSASRTSRAPSTVSTVQLLRLGPDLEEKPAARPAKAPPKDPRQEHEQWVQQREHEVQSVYRVSSEKSIARSSEVTKRLYQPHVRDPITGVPSWLHSLRDATRSRSEALLPRNASKTASVSGSSRASLKVPPREDVDIPPPGLEPIYRYGANGSVVGPFHLSDLKLKPLGEGAR